MTAKLITPVFRVSFPSVFEPSGFNGGLPKYSLMAVWEPARFSAKEKEQWKALNDLLDQVSVEKFKKKIASLPPSHRRPIRDGEEKAELAGFGEGKVFATLSSKLKPGIIYLDRTPLIDPEDFYPGCYARATVTAYAYDNVGKGVSLGLQNLQKIKDGDRLDSRTDPENDFESNSDVDDRWLGDDETDPLA